MTKVEGKTFEEILSGSPEMKRAVSTTFFFLASFGSVLWYFVGGLGVGRALLYGFGIVYGAAIAFWLLVTLFVVGLYIVVRTPLTARFVPLWMQKPFYLSWKKKTSEIRVHPLFDYPMILYIHTQLDNDFLEGGIVLAVKRLEERADQLANKGIPAFFDSIIENKFGKDKVATQATDPT